MIGAAMPMMRPLARIPFMLGGSADFYWVDGLQVRTDASLAMEGALDTGWRGQRWRIWRTNAMTTAAGELPDKPWVIDALKNIINSLGNDGMLIQVVADKTILANIGYTTDAYAISDSVYDALALATATPEIVFQVGNEPYVGASGTHAELNATYAARAIEVATGIKALHPTAKCCGPAVGTFRMTTRALCESETDSQWAQFVALFDGHAIFDYWGGNVYRWDHTPLFDNTDYGVVYGVQALRANAAALGVSPIITEIGLLDPTAAALETTLRAAGSDIPQVIWRVGAGDDYDLIGGGAIEVPTV